MKRLISLSLVASFVAGCVSVAPSASPTAEPEPPKTVYGQLFDRLSPDGIPDKQLAMDAFATAIAPLPGVNPPTGPEPLPHEIKSGTFAVRWITRYYDELTPEQRAAVDAASQPSEDFVEVPTGPIASSGPIVGQIGQPSTELQHYRDLLKDAEIKIGQRLGRTLPTGVWIASLLQPDDPQALAATRWIPGGCLFKISADLRAMREQYPKNVETTLAHEMFHCFQLRMDLGLYNAAPSWIVEGQGEWAGEAIAGPSETSGLPFWEKYLSEPVVQLYGRAHDATGFYWHLLETGIDPWTRLDRMLRESASNDAAFRAAGAESESFLSSWASGHLRFDPTWGMPWNASALWLSDSKAITDFPEVANGTSVPVSVAKVTNRVYNVTSKADIVEFRLQAHARLRLASGDLVNLDGVHLCTKLGGCKCPQEMRYVGPALTDAPPGFYLGVTGALSGAEGALVGHRLEDFCEPESDPSPAGDSPCGTGCSSSTGEPHLTTVDAIGYDFQATGEYVLLRSADGTFEVQSRQVPLVTNAAVTVNSAVAVRAGEHRVAMYTESGRLPPLEVRVDGEVVDASTPIDLGGGARVATYSRGVQVDFADGSQLWAIPTGGGCCINILLAASDALTENGVGLLGNVTPGGARLPALPDATRLPRPADRHEQFVQLYEQLGPAWLVTDDTSLFDYEPGQSTIDFVVPGFPEETKYRTLEDLPPGVRAQGEALCADVTDSERFLECVFDVSIADFIDWAEGYILTVQLEETGPVAIGAPAPQAPKPPPDELPQGFLRVTDEIAWIDEAQLGEDGRLYLAVRDRDDVRSVIAVDTSSGAIVAETTLEHYGPIAITSDSVWVGTVKDFACLVKRLDPDSLAEIATIPIECDFFKSQFAALSEDIWFLDRTTADIDAQGGTLRRIDATTNQVGTADGDAVTVPFTNGYLLSSDEAIFWRADAIDESGDNQIYRLDPGAAELVSLGRPDGLPPYPGGRGIWAPVQAESGIDAVYRTRAEAPDAVVFIDGSLVGGDASSAFVSGYDFDSTPILLRYPIDGTAPAVVATGVGLETSVGWRELDYIGQRPLLVANDLVVMYWLVPSPDDPEVLELVLQATHLT